MFIIIINCILFCLLLSTHYLNADLSDMTSKVFFMVIYFFVYLLTAIGLTPCGSTIVHICTKTIH
jgi:hypothetical protein